MSGSKGSARVSGKGKAKRLEDLSKTATRSSKGEKVTGSRDDITSWEELNLWRTTIGILLLLATFKTTLYVESHPMEAASGRLFTSAYSMLGLGKSPGTLGFQVIEATGGNSILDTGFFLTQPLYEQLKKRQWLNDLLALANSLSLAAGVVCELALTNVEFPGCRGLALGHPSNPTHTCVLIAQTLSTSPSGRAVLALHFASL